MGSLPASNVLSRPSADDLADHLRGALGAAVAEKTPYRHWLLSNILPPAALAALRTLPFPTPPAGDNAGQRATHNAERAFITPAARAAFPVASALAEAFQAPETIRLLTTLCATTFAATSLRIEYCQDRDGFWLEPHTDIGEKRFTMLIYLSDHPDAEQWGTDILDGPEGNLVKRASGAANTGLIFLPAADTWHGFARRPITGIRRTLIINYVGRTWRARHELAFPEQPIG